MGNCKLNAASFTAKAQGAGFGNVGNPVNVPMLFYNFDGYAPPESLSSDPFNSGANIVSDDTEAFSGSRSAKISFNAGGTAGGAQKNLDRDYSEGDEIWCRFRAKFETGFLFNAGAGFKFLRFHCEDSDNNHNGYLDWYNASERYLGENERAWYYRNEARAGQNTSFGDFTTENADRGNWHTYEMYVKLHSDPLQGMVRMWRDDSLLLELDDNTIQTPTHRIDRIHLCTFFNPSPAGESFDITTRAQVANADAANGSPQAQSYWVDDLVIHTSDSPPINTDINNNIFIGS